MSKTTIDKVQFKERVHNWAGKLDARVTSVSVRSMRTKWASYSTAGRLTFDSSLMGLRHELQDYVIVHELLHDHVPNHGKLWKSLMRAHVGDHEALAEELKRIENRRRLAE